MVQAIKNQTWIGVPDDLTAADANATFQRTACTACQLSKSNRLPRGEGSGIHPQFPGQVITTDYQGMISPTSVRGFTGYYVFKGLYSGYRHAVMTRDKSSASFEEALSYVINFYNLHGHVVKKIRFDAGTFLSSNRIDVDPAAVKSQFQNPVEREVQTINKGVAALLIDQSTLGPSF